MKRCYLFLSAFVLLTISAFAQNGGVIISAGPGGNPNIQTSNYTLAATDCGGTIVMNGSSITFTLASPPPSATCPFWVQNLNSTSLTISRNGLTINGGTSNVSVGQYDVIPMWTDGTNYYAKPPLIIGTGLTLTPAANGQTIALGSAHAVETPLVCADSSASGTAQSCTTSPSFSPAANDCIIYTTTTSNTGSLTLNVNSSGAAAVQKWMGTAVASGDVQANHPQLACYDGTHWQLMTIGNAPSGGGGTTTNALTFNNGGSGAASGSTFNGSAAVTVSYNTIGAAASNASTTANGQSCALGSSCNVNTGATAHTVAINEGNGSAIAGAGPGTSGQVLKSAGSGADPTYIDFPETLFIPAVNCNNTTAGAGWSIGASGSISCRAGTNNLGGFITITDTSSSFAQFTITIPEDWDTSTNPYIRFQVASTDVTGGHTIIPSIQVSCAKGDGSTTDDVTFNAAHSSSTITTNTTNHQFWSSSNVQMNSTDMTGCVAGALMIVQVGRATDTATNAEFYGATVTFPRLITVQAN